MDSKQISELAKLLRINGDKILSSEFTFRLSGKLQNITFVQKSPKRLQYYAHANVQKYMKNQASNFG